MSSFVFNNILASIVVFLVVCNPLAVCDEGPWLQPAPRRRSILAQDAKAQRIAKWRCLPFFATFAYFAAWRESGSLVRGIRMWLNHPALSSRPGIPALPSDKTSTSAIVIGYHSPARLSSESCQNVRGLQRNAFPGA
jgi:hypothetical protein